MIEFRNVSKQYGPQIVLDEVSFRINPAERVGVVGPNGAGKSTLFSLLVGESEPDHGEVASQAGARLGYVRQQLAPHRVAESLLEYAENARPELHALQAEMEGLEEQLRTGGAERPAALMRRLGELQTRFEAEDGYALRNRAERSLCGLGFDPSSLRQPFRTFSGGWQSRAELARVLVAQPEILLLDEPSNYLDIPAIEWLQRYLKEFRGTLLLISHDRFLLNSLTTVTLEVANGRVERYPGCYDVYARERERRSEQREAAWKNQERRREQIERFIERFKSKNTKASQAQSRVKMLAKLDEIELPPPIRSPGHIRLKPPPHSGAEVMRLEGAGLTYDRERWVLRGVDLSVMRGDKLALVGLNGLGKTTLLRMLAGALPLSEGRRVVGHKVTIGYQSQDFADTMDPRRTVYETVKSVAADLSEQEVRTLLGGFGFSGVAIEKAVDVLSGGEKIRLAFARLLVKPPNFLILDEPTTHLDIQAREALEEALADFDGTLCVVSHDIDFVRRVAGGIIAMTPPGITRYAGGYDYYKEKTGGQGSGDRGQEPEGRSQKSEAGGGAPAAGAQPATADRRELRRQRAFARQEIYNRTRDLKKTLQDAEIRLDKLEGERAELALRLSGGTQGTSLDYAEMNRRLGEIQEEIEAQSQRWEDAATQLEAIAAEAAATKADGKE